MDKYDNELEKLEKLAESFGTMGNITQVMRDSYARLELKYEDVNSRLAQINDFLRKSLSERNRLAHYLSNILESIDTGVVVTDDSGIINVFNSMSENYIGIKAELALGQKYTKILSDAAISEKFAPNFDNSGKASGEITLNGQAGRAIPVAYTITRLCQENPEDQSGQVVILYNLSEIKRLEENLKRVSALAALGEMAATVAHEIRNPLAGISGFTALLLRDLDKDNDNRRLVEKIGEGVAALNAIVGSLLDFTRAVSPEISEVDTVSIVEDTIQDLKFGHDKTDHVIELKTKSRKLNARLDPQLFRMVVANLIKNAMQASPDGGKIRLTLAKNQSGELSLIVEDSGPGIAPETMERLFTPFFTTRTTGTGLGLATVKKLTELHGGRVFAENRPEGGARFQVQIPDSAKGNNK
jgi:signal transduction histidine kinase